ncbi:MAG: restriction endonuclease subunit S [Burkholderiaceae bacterium]|nr:restriction endonuclease subunit S [Burkholderiaceae bacterium]
MIRTATIEAACDLVTDGTHYTPKNIGRGVPFLTVKDVTDEVLDFSGCSFISDDDYRLAKAGNSAPQQGDVLFSKDGTVGKVHVVSTDKPFAVLSSLAILRPRAEAVDPKYFGHVLRSPRVLDDALKRKTGSAIRRVILSDLKRVRVPLPPLPEQRRIAEILDKADALRAKRRAALAQLDTLTQSIFLDMFGDPATNPKRFPFARLDALVREGDSINYGVVQPGEDCEDGVPLVRVGDLQNGRVEHAALKRISPSIESSYKRSRLRGDEILVSCVGSTGVIALADPSVKGFNIARAVARVPLANSIDRPYTATYLRTEFVQRYFKNELRTVSQPTLNIKQLSELLVLRPPSELREEFGRRSEALARLGASQRESLDAFDAAFNSLQHRAFRGEL